MLRKQFLMATIALSAAASCSFNNAKQHGNTTKPQKHAHGNKDLKNKELENKSLEELNQIDQELSSQLNALAQEDQDPRFVGMHQGRTKPISQQITQTIQKLKRVINHRKKRLESMLKQYKNNRGIEKQDTSHDWYLVPR